MADNDAWRLISVEIQDNLITERWWTGDSWAPVMYRLIIGPAPEEANRG